MSETWNYDLLATGKYGKQVVPTLFQKHKILTSKMLNKTIRETWQHLDKHKTNFKQAWQKVINTRISKTCNKHQVNKKTYRLMINYVKILNFVKKEQTY